MNKNNLFLKAILVLIEVSVLIATFIGLPFFADYLASNYPEYAHTKWPLLIGLMATTIPFSIAILQAFRLLRLIDQSNPFSQEAIQSFKTIRICALLIIVLYIGGFIYLEFAQAGAPWVLILGLAIISASILIAICADLLAKLFSQAYEIKLENDLTI